MNALHPDNIDQFFNIPIYQRLFTWGEEQIRLLLDDLLYKAMTSPKSNHYIGVLTTTNNSDRMDLVDGQQRFTVMVLMGIVMTRYFDKWKFFLMSGDEKLRLDFSARPDDQKYLEKLIEAASVSKNNVSVDNLLEENNGLNYENDTMKRGLVFIRDYMNDIDSHCSRVLEGIESTANKNDDESLQKFFTQYVFGHLSFFIQKLPNDYTPRMLNKHFESMNSTGRNLENHEILKVQLLKEVGTQEYRQMVSIWNRASRMNEMMFPIYEEDKRKEYFNKIRSVVKNEPGSYNDDKSDNEKSDELKESDSSILHILSNKRPEFSSGNPDNGAVYRPFITFTDFLLNVLYIQIEDENPNVNKQQFFNPDNLLKTCAKYIGKNKIKETEFIKAVYCYRIIFDYYVIRIDGNGSYRLAAAGDESHNKLEQYQAMLYSGTSRYTYYQWIPVVLKYIKNHLEDKELNDKLLGELKETDSKIEEHKFEKFSGDTSFKGFSNYFFRRLDYYLWELFIDKNWRNRIKELFPAEYTDSPDIDNLKKAVVNYRFSQNNNSVEHFEPRNEDEQITKWEDKDKINSFGNLALVSGSFNSTQNNDSLKLKFARVDDQILKENKLESIKLALMFYSAQKDASKWTIELMEKHKNLMIGALKKSYDK